MIKELLLPLLLLHCVIYFVDEVRAHRMATPGAMAAVGV